MNKQLKTPKISHALMALVFIPIMGCADPTPTPMLVKHDNVYYLQQDISKLVYMVSEIQKLVDFKINPAFGDPSPQPSIDPLLIHPTRPDFKANFNFNIFSMCEFFEDTGWENPQSAQCACWYYDTFGQDDQAMLQATLWANRVEAGGQCHPDFPD